MDLSEFLKANPAAVAEIGLIKAEAKAEGRKEAQADYSARVGKVLPVMQSAAYPANIKTIACNVLSGAEEMAAFTATVAAFDSMKEAAASAAARSETAGLGGALAEEPGNPGGAADPAGEAWAKSAADARARKEKAAKEAR